MQTRFFVPVVAVAVALLLDSNVLAQSMFGGRGPISGTTGTKRPFSPGTSQGATSPATGGGSAAVGSSGGFVGRGKPSGSFIGARQSTRQGSETPSRRSSGQPRPSGGSGAGSETSQGPAENLRTAGSSRRPVRARERIAFAYTAPKPTAIQAALASQFATFADRFPIFEGIEAQTTRNGQVTLRGEVSSDENRQLIELVVRMQPGVRSVRNELMIGGTSNRQLYKSDSR